MASAAAKAVRKAEARQRLDREVTAIAHRLHIDIPDPTGNVRDAELAPILDLERQAAILANVNAALEELGVEVPEIDEVKGIQLDTSSSRDELNRLAADLGIDDAADKSKYPNKDAVIAVIEAAIASTGDEEDSNPGDGEPESEDVEVPEIEDDQPKITDSDPTVEDGEE